MKQTLLPSLLLLSILFGACVEESDTILTFDVELESTRFQNRLYAPVVLYRDNEVLDTIPASSDRTYRLGRRGPVQHAWRLISPRDRYGVKVGVEPAVSLGVQYRLVETYEITNDIPGGSSPKGGTIFTPLVANYSPYDVELTANDDEDDEVRTNYLIRRGTGITLDSLPYFYWHGTSNVLLRSTTNSYYWFFERADTLDPGKLELDESREEYVGTGRTNVLLVN